jgi:hypothetical protein
MFDRSYLLKVQMLDISTTNHTDQLVCVVMETVGTWASKFIFFAIFQLYPLCRSVLLVIEWLLFNANSAISWQEQVNFQCDDDEIRFVLLV